MSNFENSSFLAIVPADLALVTGGYDFRRAVQAGNAAAGPGREAGETLGAGFDAGYRVVTGRDTNVGRTVGGPTGAAVGWVGGFATDTWQQLWGSPSGQPLPAAR